ncbi:elongation factor P maturation arginine rhamnosyltransferase EarP [Arsukibacterium indicum]|uniref:Protein-arginine rhamnosyltransferase n=1 Tax=Arsukibacterium indicum TaxID=2848612 RepID=A0ABS6MHV4_9GAMM|nr:elongation factor P maturation arginine rhamnosyltransferase EarP [Arsukibacterium indicum]MBV2128401.1 elongation factor P maturation arginine rhamnosyltransferase EarP [Arsukibacterium indicum]
MQQLNQSDERGLWRVFCSVVDNFGDIGICWRLSRQLVAEHNIRVELLVDDLHSFKQICPQVRPELASQTIAGVEILFWPEENCPSLNWQQLTPAAVVIEALACTIPDVYKQLMASQQPAPLWLNLEYLSAEAWVEGCHGLSSPQGHGGGNKYFFFPGFSNKTGGLLYEQDLSQRLDAFKADNQAQQRFWQQLGLNTEQFELKISMFAYSHSQIASLLKQWQQLTVDVLCVIPQGELANELARQYPQLLCGAIVQLNQLYLKVIPFLAQPDYDLLLAACDLNFVRGEDSIIRAQWAGRPFIWQIYRQQENAHLLKLAAFLDHYCRQMPIGLADITRQSFLSWNTDSDLTDSWNSFYPVMQQLADYNLLWRAQLLANGDLASNLVHFAKKKFIITPNFSQQ